MTTPSTRAWGEEPAVPSASDLAGARALFAEALRDEEAKRFADALQKLLHVRSVRDTAPIEYRIGTCYEGLGRPVPAYVAYREAKRLGEDDEHSADVTAAANERLEALQKRVARLTLALPEGTPADARLRVDDTDVPLSTLGEPLILEPGPHVVTATASQSVTTRSEIALPEGAQVLLTVPVGAAPARATPPRATPSAPPPAGEHEVNPGNPARTAGFVLSGSGAALLAGAGALVLLRSSDISKLNGACQGGQCPVGADQAGLESTRSRALAEGPVAGALAAAGALSAGLGVYLLLAHPDPVKATTQARLVPVLGSNNAGVAVSGLFR